MSDSPRTVCNDAGRVPDRNSIQRSSAASRVANCRAGVVTHPPAPAIAAFVDRTLPFREQARVMEHLADCTLCRELVKSISPQIDFGVRAVAAAIREEWRHRPVVAAPRGRIRWGILAAIAGIIVAAASYWTVERANFTAERNAPGAPYAEAQTGLISSHPAAEQGPRLTANFLPGPALDPSQPLLQGSETPAYIAGTAAHVR